MRESNKLLKLSNTEGVEIFFNTNWLFNKTLGKDLNSAELLIRLLAIDEYLGKNNCGFELYNKMQLKRIEVNKKIPNPKENYEYEFKSLIESIKINGFYSKSALELNKNFEVFDGAHRLACAIAFNIEKLPVKFSNKYINKTYDYSIKWFRKNGLVYLEPYIINKYNELIDKKIIVRKK